MSSQNGDIHTLINKAREVITSLPWPLVQTADAYLSEHYSVDALKAERGQQRAEVIETNKEIEQINAAQLAAKEETWGRALQGLRWLHRIRRHLSGDVESDWFRETRRSIYHATPKRRRWGAPIPLKHVPEPLGEAEASWLARFLRAWEDRIVNASAKELRRLEYGPRNERAMARLLLFLAATDPDLHTCGLPLRCDLLVQPWTEDEDAFAVRRMAGDQIFEVGDATEHAVVLSKNVTAGHHAQVESLCMVAEAEREAQGHTFRVIGEALNVLASVPQQPAHVERKNNVDDKPDKSGYVRTPSSPDDYMAVTELLKLEDTWKVAHTLKKINGILKENPTTIRWTRPLSLEGIPIKNRKSIHIGDWSRFIRGQCDDADPTQDEIAERKLKIRRA